MTGPRITKFDEGIISIPIRADVTVRISGIPWNMTALEAARVVKVIQAYGVTESELSK